MSEVFTMKITQIQPSKLFISSDELREVFQQFTPITTDSLPPVPVKKLKKKSS